MVPPPKKKMETGDFALAKQVYDISQHFILFDPLIIAPVKGIMQVFREAVEIKKHVHRKAPLNTDTGKTYLSPIYSGLINLQDLALGKKEMFDLRRVRKGCVY